MMSAPDKLIRHFKQYMYEKGFIRSKTFVNDERPIVITDINKNSLLNNIAMNGLESYEHEVVLLIKNYSRKLSTFIDVGANVGYFSMLAELYFESDTKIIAIEPFPRNIEFIKKLKKLNGFQFELIEKAVANENGKQILYYPFHKSSSKLAMTGSLVNVFLGTDSKFKDIPYKTVNVDTITLEDACASTRNATLIKLDCEGNELPILRSSPSILNREDVDFIIEVLVGDKNKHEIFKLMKEYNYRGFLITHGGLIDEDRPLTLSNPNNKSRTLWRNHFFTKKSKSEVQQFSNKCYGISSLH